MKRLLLVLSLCARAFAGYANFYTFTIDHTKVSTGDQSNYVLAIVGTYSFLKVSGSGGDIQHTTTCCANTETVPADMIFTTTLPTAGTCTKNLDWDIPYYVSTTGAIEIHVGPLSVSSTVDTPVYMCTKNAAVTTYQSTYTSAWPAMFQSVYHWGDLTTLDLHDSTVNAHTATNHGATLGTGIAGGGLATNGSQYANVAGMPSGNNLRTLIAFVKSSTTATTQAVFDMGDLLSNGDRWVSYIDTSNQFHLDVQGAALQAACAVSCTDGAWHEIESHQHDTLASAHIAISSETHSTSGSPLPINTVASPQVVSTAVNALGTIGLNGVQDELELFNTDQSTNGYALTRWNNFNSPSTFYSVSSSSPVGGVSIRHRVSAN